MMPVVGCHALPTEAVMDEFSVRLAAELGVLYFVRGVFKWVFNIKNGGQKLGKY